jgi:DNA-binding response OmpR family regulator
MDLIRTTAPSVVTLGVGLKGSPSSDALSLFRTIRKESPKTLIVVVGASQPDNQGVFLREGALECIAEPFDSPGLERMWKRLSDIYPELKRTSQAASGR